MILTYGVVVAELFDVPTPTPWEQLDKHNTPNNGGINFGVAGASVTYAYGHGILDAQVDRFTKLAEGRLWTQAHLRNCVALVSIGINDYTFYNIYGAHEVTFSVPPYPIIIFIIGFCENKLEKVK